MLFGWCSTGHHTECRKMYVDSFSGTEHVRKCECDCHVDES
jgi:hypothetical protein